MLGVTPANFWLVGDLNARFCPISIATDSSQANAPSIAMVRSCENSRATDCASDTPVKGFL